MKLFPMKQMLSDAREGGYAIGAFEFWSLDSAQAVVNAAQELRVPVILQAGELEIAYIKSYADAAKIARMAADGVDIPVALHLDHGDTIEQVKSAIDAGFTSVMIDSSRLPYDENVEATLKVVEIASPCGVTVEAELGVLAGSEGKLSHSEAEATQTTPEEAARFARDTGVDVLAVAIGTAHGFYQYEPEINIGRLKKIAAAVSLPLVLHGGSGTPDAAVREAVSNGIAKINICTEFIAAYGKAYAYAQNADGFKYNVKSLFGKGAAAGQDLAYKKLEWFLNGKTAKL